MENDEIVKLLMAIDLNSGETNVQHVFKKYHYVKPMSLNNTINIDYLIKFLYVVNVYEHVCDIHMEQSKKLLNNNSDMDSGNDSSSSGSYEMRSQRSTSSNSNSSSDEEDFTNDDNYQDIYSLLGHIFYNECMRLQKTCDKPTLIAVLLQLLKTEHYFKCPNNHIIVEDYIKDNDNIDDIFNEILDNIIDILQKDISNEDIVLKITNFHYSAMRKIREKKANVQSVFTK